MARRLRGLVLRCHNLRGLQAQHQPGGNSDCPTQFSSWGLVPPGGGQEQGCSPQAEPLPAIWGGVSGSSSPSAGPDGAAPGAARSGAPGLPACSLTLSSRTLPLFSTARGLWSQENAAMAANKEQVAQAISVWWCFSCGDAGGVGLPGLESWPPQLRGANGVLGSSATGPCPPVGQGKGPGSGKLRLQG